VTALLPGGLPHSTWYSQALSTHKNAKNDPKIRPASRLRTEVKNIVERKGGKNMPYLKLFRKLAILAMLASAAFAYNKPAQPLPPTSPSLICGGTCSQCPGRACAWSIVDGHLIWHGCC